jgi:hypothetical protein
MPPAVRSFANQFVSMKNKREEADYEPLAKFKISDVRNNINAVETALQQFDECDLSTRQAFATFVGVRGATRSTP